jgi:hypothetical protein
MAPKVEEMMYGPFKADRWSCRRVLLYILDELRKEDETPESNWEAAEGTTFQAATVTSTT